jgi:hypothetical protein
MNQHEIAELLDIIRYCIEQECADISERRIAANMIRRRLQELAPEPIVVAARVVEQDGRPGWEPMRHDEMQNYGHGTLGYGQYASTPMAEVDIAYLAWLADSKREDARQLTRYIKAREKLGPVSDYEIWHFATIKGEVPDYLQ